MKKNRLFTFATLSTLAFTSASIAIACSADPGNNVSVAPITYNVSKISNNQAQINFNGLQSSQIYLVSLSKKSHDQFQEIKKINASIETTIDNLDSNTSYYFKLLDAQDNTLLQGSFKTMIENKVTPNPTPTPKPTQPPTSPQPKPTPEPTQPPTSPEPNPTPEQPAPTPEQPAPTPEQPAPTPEQPAPTPKPNPKPTQPPSDSASTSRNVVVTSSTNLKIHSGYDNSNLTTINEVANAEDNKRFSYTESADTTNFTTTWSAQKDSINGSLKDSDFLISNRKADSPEYNPNNNTFKTAKEQRDEIYLSTNGDVNPVGNVYVQNYNFWYNYKIQSTRSHSNLERTHIDSLAKAPQPIKLPDKFNSMIKQMDSTEGIKFNQESLKYLVTHNEMGQNPKMFAWKLITLSDEIRMNQKSIISDQIPETKIKDNEKTMRLFQNLPNGTKNIKFYTDEKGANNTTGVLKIYVVYTDANNKEHVLEKDLTPDYAGLKRDVDYLAAIGDRSFVISYRYAGYFDSNDDYTDDKNTTFKPTYDTVKQYASDFNRNPSALKSRIDSYYKYPKSKNLKNVTNSGGTAWLVDRIIEDGQDPKTKQDVYSFIVATNKHVADISRYSGANISGGRLNSDGSNPFPSLSVFKGENAGRYDEQNRQRLNAQVSWTNNSGFDTFMWSRFIESDQLKYENVKQIPFWEIEGGRARESGDYWNQMIYYDTLSLNAKPSPWRPVTNIH
ncbi:hypothetical protein EI74_0227 [Mycoplasma testudineum]|uniref:Fibronectin type-III domain-containing protein n=1 Tax=Mycoplasma testudineum TaxID=244584 RepID=A0A4R6IH21_9MOLU|nr:hypothetical protein [Mycoplasma testudineum]OYD27049.1 hypothetical protein CG473_00140 [Mycoplasma testudineum]TDO21196.1 hypothetical protein EI74_0227 [Mycoplasma testudineum]